MKKIITLIVLSLTFLIVGCKANAEDLIDRILKTEVVEGKESVAQRIDTLAHMALLNSQIIDIDLYSKSVGEATEDKFTDYIYKLGNSMMEMNEDAYDTIYEVLDIQTMRDIPYFEPVSIVNTSDTRKEIMENDNFDTVLRVTYDSPDKYVAVDIPFVEFGDKTIMVNSAKAVVTIGKGANKKAYPMEDGSIQVLYWLTKSLEELDYYEYDLMESGGNPSYDVYVESLPRVTDPRVLNQSVARDVASYEDENLKSLSDDFSIRYSSFDKKDRQFGEKYVYFIFFGKDGYTYRVSCSREGILELNVYAGSGGFLYYTIPDMSKAHEIFSESFETGKQTMLDFDNLTDADVEHIHNIEEIIGIMRRMAGKTGIVLGV